MARPAPKTPAASKAALAAAAPPPEATKADKADVILMMDELIDVCRTQTPKFAEQGSKEDDKTYIQRVISTVAEVDDVTFESMVPATKDWYNAAGEAINEGKTFPMPDGFVSKFGAKATTAGKTPAAAKEPKAPKAPPPPRAPGVTMRIRELVVANPGWKLEVLEKALVDEKLSIKRATTSTIRSDVLATMTAAKKMGVSLAAA